MPEGVILAYSKDVNAGIIQCEKEVYPFPLREWKSDIPPDNDMKVLFDLEGETVKNVRAAQ